MKRLYSLKGRKVFQTVFRDGRRIAGSGVILIVLRDDRTNQKRGKIGNGGKGKTEMNSKIAITVRKRYGNAVARNRTKRILRAACRDVIPALKQGYYIIIQPKDSFKDMRFIEIRNDIKRVFSKSGVIV